MRIKCCFCRLLAVLFTVTNSAYRTFSGTFCTEGLCVIIMCGVKLRYRALLHWRDDGRANVLDRCTGAICCNMWNGCVAQNDAIIKNYLIT